MVAFVCRRGIMAWHYRSGCLIRSVLMREITIFETNLFADKNHDALATSAYKTVLVIFMVTSG